MHYLNSLPRIALKIYPKPTLGDLGQRALFILRYLHNYPHAPKWVRFLATDRMAPIARQNPSLYRKPIRPYVSLSWPAHLRVAAMIYHYEFLARRLTPAVFQQVASPAGDVLLSFPTKNGDELTVRLRYDSKFRKEGEATLELESAKYNCRVFSLTFVIAPSETGAPCVVIGAVCGLPAGADKDIIKHTAKALFGLRPKALLLLLLQELAQAWGVKALLGVGSRVHTSRHLDYALNRSRRFTITYDAFWQEAGGALRSDGFHALPLSSPCRNLEEIEPHKRSLYRQRYLLTGELQDRLRTGLRNWQTNPGAPAMTGWKFIPPQEKLRLLPQPIAC